MIQDIYPHKLNNTYDRNAIAEKNDFALYVDNSKLLVKKGEGDSLTFAAVGDFPEDTPFTYLFTVDEERFFLIRRPVEIPADCEMMELFALRRRGGMEKRYVFAAFTAKHLADWYRDTRFCGRCGMKTEHSKRERASVCPACGYTAYPRIMPAVIVGVTNGDKLLLTKYRVGYGHNALIAGFTEIGETAEETVAREVMEEAGIRVKNIRYYKSQPWGLPNDLLMGFYCDVDGDTEIHMDNQELKYAQWVQREAIELQPDDFSLTNEMMMMFKSGKQ